MGAGTGSRPAAPLSRAALRPGSACGSRPGAPTAGEPAGPRSAAAAAARGPAPLPPAPALPLGPLTPPRRALTGVPAPSRAGRVRVSPEERERQFARCVTAPSLCAVGRAVGAARAARPELGASPGSQFRQAQGRCKAAPSAPPHGPSLPAPPGSELPCLLPAGLRPMTANTRHRAPGRPSGGPCTHQLKRFAMSPSPQAGRSQASCAPQPTPALLPVHLRAHRGRSYMYIGSACFRSAQVRKGAQGTDLHWTCCAGQHPRWSPQAPRG